MLFIRSIFGYILQGAAITFGSVLVSKGFEVVKDPVKKEKLKRKCKNVKNAFTS